MAGAAGKMGLLPPEEGGGGGGGGAQTQVEDSLHLYLDSAADGVFRMGVQTNGGGLISNLRVFMCACTR